MRQSDTRRQSEDELLASLGDGGLSPHHALLDMLPQLACRAYSSLEQGSQLNEGTSLRVQINKAWREYTDGSVKPAGDLNSVLSSIHPEDRERTAKHFVEVLADTDVKAFPIRVRCRDGRFQWHLLELRRTHPFADECIGIAVAMDPSNSQREMLRRPFQTCEETDRATFFATASHELRTPLSALLGFVELLQNPGLSLDDRRNFLEKLRINGKLLARLLDDVLSMSRMDAGEIQIECLPVSPQKTLEDVCSSLEKSARDKGIKIQSFVQGAVPSSIFSDPTRLKQILFNVIGNAVKFTEGGEVRVKLEMHEKEQGQELICFSVSDTGPGIPPEHCQELFRPFSQAGASVSRRYGGSGLGLAISRRLARLLGGDVALKETRLGFGSEFQITIASLSTKSLEVKTQL